jgi:hypothetical protein
MKGLKSLVRLDVENTQVRGGGLRHLEGLPNLAMVMTTDGAKMLKKP